MPIDKKIRYEDRPKPFIPSYINPADVESGNIIIFPQDSIKPLLDDDSESSLGLKTNYKKLAAMSESDARDFYYGYLNQYHKPKDLDQLDLKQLDELLQELLDKKIIMKSTERKIT